MKSLRHRFLYALSSGWLALLLGCPSTPSVPEISILVDPSASGGHRCDCLGTLGQRALRTPRLSKSSNLSLFTLGNVETANEPRLIDQYSIAPARGTLEKGGSTHARGERLFNELKERCERIPPTNQSPIFLGIKRVVEYLRSRGCGADRVCYLYVVTDGEEQAELGIQQALKIQAGKSSSALPPPITNQGIHIIFSGLAETKGLVRTPGGKEHRYTQDRNPLQADQLQKVWAGLFTDTTLVSFEPFCTAKENTASSR